MSLLLVAIPVWRGDHERVLRNLQKQFERDGKVKHHATVFLDGVKKDAHIEELAAKCFASVDWVYFGASEAKPWPIPQNRVWQSIARYMEAHPDEACRAWFLWESDALPLKAQWIDTLADAYVSGRKPFMGHIVPNRNHMNAVAVYPFGISAYCTNALLVKSAPFDVTLSREMSLGNITKANHLIAHHLKARGGDPAQPMTDPILKSLPESTVIIHGYYEPSGNQVKHLNDQRKLQAMNETSKAMRRRRCEEASGGFKWSEVLRGEGVDVGAGTDPVQIPGCRAFDVSDGDANFLSRYFKEGSLDYVHGSQVLEHMIEPRAALLNWALCVKKGGYLVVSVPSWAHYEHCQWPSTKNSDHKSAWSMELRGAPNCPVLVHIPSFCNEMRGHGLKCLKMELCDFNYDYSAAPEIDQTLSPDGPEAFYEMVFQKQ